jgi:hypothetical protein
MTTWRNTIVRNKRNQQHPAAAAVAPARSRDLHKAGFASLREANSCADAVRADLEGGLIGAAEANAINDAVGRWQRAHIRKGGR